MSLSSPFLTRRAALIAGASLPLAAGLGLPSAARASAEMKGMAAPQYNRFKLGAFEVTSIMAGTRTVEEPQKIFGMNVTPEEFAAASEANLIPIDKAQFFFTPTVVNTGESLVLFDTGLNAAGTTAALAAAGYTPDQIDTVVLTHMHGDHIGGLMNDGTPTYANANYVTGQVEFDTSKEAAADNFVANVEPLAEKMSFIGDGGAVTGGITGIEAFGHTPGHMVYMIESNGQQLVIAADFANHYVWSLAYPDWEVRFDRDKAGAAATRRRLLDMMAADKTPFIGYHMPFPAVGFVETRGDGYHYVPGHYQMMMNA